MVKICVEVGILGKPYDTRVCIWAELVKEQKLYEVSFFLYKYYELLFAKKKQDRNEKMNIMFSNL